MIKLAKLSLVCFLISLFFEVILLSLTIESDVKLSFFICFAFHTLNLICFIFYVVHFKTISNSRVLKIKHGIFCIGYIHLIDKLL